MEAISRRARLEATYLMGGEMARLWGEKHVPAHCEYSQSDNVSVLVVVLVRCFAQTLNLARQRRGHFQDFELDQLVKINSDGWL